MLSRGSFQDTRFLVTGAASGFGRAMAQRLARSGSNIILTGRSLDRMDEVVRGLVINGDVFALVVMSRGRLPHLKSGDWSSLVNIGSIVASRAIPGSSEYSASKFAVAGFTESIRAEWSKFGIHDPLINPGFIAKEFEKNLVVDTSRYPTQQKRIMTADRVAQKSLKAIFHGQSEVTLSPDGRLILIVNNLLPRLVDFSFALFTRRVFADVLQASRIATKTHGQVALLWG